MPVRIQYISAIVGGGANPIIIITSSLPNATVGVFYSVPIIVTGGMPPYTWSIASGSLPAGLSIDSSSGVISGTPTGGGTFNFVVLVIDGFGGNATLTVNG